MTPKAPVIDWEALSPLVALAGGACIVLLVGLLRSGFVRRHVVPALAMLTLAITAGLGVWQWGVNTEVVERRAGDRRPDAVADDGVLRRRHRRGAAVVALARGGRGRRGRVLRAAAQLDPRHGRAGRGPEPRRAVPRLRAALDPAVRAVRDAHAARAVAGVGPEVPDHRLGRVGDAALRPGHALRGDRVDRLRRHRRGGDLGRAALHRHRAGGGGPGLQGVGGALPPVDAGRLRGRADRRSRASWRSPPRRRPSA